MAQLRVTELDFDTIKQNLKNYIQNSYRDADGNLVFTDYDFEGSGLSTLLDVLAYNTHYNAFMANMLANEMFLDSAVKRSSAVSLAKHLGYTPRSIRSSRAVLDVVVTGPTGSPSSLTLDRYTPFTTSIDGTTYTFLSTTSQTVEPSGGVYTFNDVEVAEGTYLTNTFTVVVPGPSEKYIIPNDNIDTTTLLVTVQNSGTDSTTEVYSSVLSFADLTSTSKVFFLEENDRGRYQIYFGDGALGKKLTAGNIVRIQYLVTSGEEANVSGSITQTFQAAASIGGSTAIAVTTVSNSTGGKARETLSEIKFNAPRFNTTANRAVTASDYAALIKANYPIAEAVKVWGGEDNDPPDFGKVYISLKPFSGFIVSTAVKEDIKNTILADRQVLTVIPEFVDPEYIFVNIAAEVKYNKNLTTASATAISDAVKSTINTYFSTQLNQFDKSFYTSQLIKSILATNESIASCLLTIRLQQRIVPTLNTANTFTGTNKIKFNNRLHPNEFESTKFFITTSTGSTPVRLKDVPNDSPPNYDGTGVIIMYNTNTGLTISNIGTINYATGEVELTSFTPTGFPATQFDIRLTSSIQEEAYDIAISRNQILTIDDSTLNTVAARLQGLTVNMSAL